MTALFHVDLKEIAQVILRWRGKTQVTLLLNGCRLSVALRDDDATQIRAMLAGHILPGSFTFVLAKMNFALLILRCQENAPAIIRHLHMTELCPAFWCRVDGGAQIHIKTMRAIRTHVIPPLQIIRLPVLKRTLQSPVF